MTGSPRFRIGSWLRDAINTSRRTRSDLASLVGVDRSRIDAMLDGRDTASIGEVLAISAITKFPVTQTYDFPATEPERAAS